MIDIDARKEQVTKTAKTFADQAAEYGTKAFEFSSDKAKELFGQTKDIANKGFEKVSTVKVGEKNVAEHAQATVDSVQSAVDVDQLSEQVSKLRDQIEGVLASWTDSFRPTTDTPTAPAAKPSKAQLSKMTVAELRDMAKTADIKGRSSMNKTQLVNALSKTSK